MANVQVKFDALNKAQQMEVIRLIDRLLKTQKPEKGDSFDEKIENDIKSGQLESLAHKAVADFKGQKFKNL